MDAECIRHQIALNSKGYDIFGADRAIPGVTDMYGDQSKKGGLATEFRYRTSPFLWLWIISHLPSAMQSQIGPREGERSIQKLCGSQERRIYPVVSLPEGIDQGNPEVEPGSRIKGIQGLESNRQGDRRR